MTAQLRTWWQNFFRERNRVSVPVEPAEPLPMAQIISPTVDIAQNDPLLAYLQSRSGPVEIERLELDSPGLTALKEAGVKITVPLVSQGELIGLINLGPRLSEQDYSTDDRRLLENLATQAAPAVRVAQLVRQQQLEAQERERIEQELRVARLIQQTLLPKEIPEIAGWRLAAYYQPAREVGGDFYDFFQFPDGRLGLVVADVTDKGVPAALVMATTRSILRASAERLRSPGQVLQRVNDLLYPDIPPRMFVTCFYMIVDQANGKIQYANAGHDLPYRHSSRSEVVEELRATGMPLGLMPGMHYEEKETSLGPGESILLYSDGLVEAHNPDRDMFGFPRLQALLADYQGQPDLVEYLLNELTNFTGDGWEQEDDVTLLKIERLPQTEPSPESRSDVDQTNETGWETLATFTFPSEQGREREAADKVVEVVADYSDKITGRRLDRLKTAVAEATMNAMEHGNSYQADLPTNIEILTNRRSLAIRITDQGSKPITETEIPDLEAKLAGLQKPRGWGLFLIQKMVDDLNTIQDDHHHTIELIVHLEGDDSGRENA